MNAFNILFNAGFVLTKLYNPESATARETKQLITSVQLLLHILRRNHVHNVASSRASTSDGTTPTTGLTDLEIPFSDFEN